MSDDHTDLNATFERWLDEPWEEDYTARQQFWFAFKAGADWALAQIRKEASIPAPSAEAPPDG